MLKDFYDKHKNFSFRTSTEYNISPGIKCKFDLLKANLNSKRIFENAIDLGSSGNSILFFLDKIKQRNFYDIADLPLKQYTDINFCHPLCGDLVKLPYRDKSFDLLTALDVLEHIKDDETAVSEISRILKKNAIIVITVPHRMDFYTNQDRIIGHYRRYEISGIISLFEKYHLKNIKIFGVYGRLMKIAEIQSTNPHKTEQSLINLRLRYERNLAFRRFWDFIVGLLTKFMKLDAKFHSLKNIMNLALIFKKQY